MGYAVITIPNFPACGFGNQALYYNNMRQLAAQKGCGFSCPSWDGVDVFDVPLYERTETEVEILDFCLGSKYHDYKTVSTRDVFVLKDNLDPYYRTCSIHIRETDFHSWMPEAVEIAQRVGYYQNSIVELLDHVDKFIIFTDDPTSWRIKEIIETLEYHKKQYTFGQNTSDRSKFANDFIEMSRCEYMISSPSTFNIVAGMTGINKKIIHSKDWINYRREKNDLFWIRLVDSSDDDYRIWKLV
jgi:hypothetical protein